MTERTKTARNEIRKINATYNNNVAVGLTIAGYWTPAVAAIINYREVAQKVASGAFSQLTPAETYTVVAVIGVSLFSMLCAYSFRNRAALLLAEIED